MRSILTQFHLAAHVTAMRMVTTRPNVLIDISPDRRIPWTRSLWLIYTTRTWYALKLCSYDLCKGPSAHNSSIVANASYDYGGSNWSIQRSPQVFRGITSLISSGIYRKNAQPHCRSRLLLEQSWLARPLLKQLWMTIASLKNPLPLTSLDRTILPV